VLVVRRWCATGRRCNSPKARFGPKAAGARLFRILTRVLERRKQRAERRRRILSNRKRAAKAEAKLKLLYDAIESGIADVSDPMLKERVTDLKAIRGQLGPNVLPMSPV
jgi:phosphoenolpyruvate-protein kinase (PTS system EI component)